MNRIVTVTLALVFGLGCGLLNHHDDDDDAGGSNGERTGARLEDACMAIGAFTRTRLLVRPDDDDDACILVGLVEINRPEAGANPGWPAVTVSAYSGLHTVQHVNRACERVYGGINDVLTETSFASGTISLEYAPIYGRAENIEIALDLDFRDGRRYHALGTLAHAGGPLCPSEE